MKSYIDYCIENESRFTVETCQSYQQGRSMFFLMYDKSKSSVFLMDHPSSQGPSLCNNISVVMKYLNEKHKVSILNTTFYEISQFGENKSIDKIIINDKIDYFGSDYKWEQVYDTIDMKNLYNQIESTDNEETKYKLNKILKSALENYKSFFNENFEYEINNGK
jgi:hypothetical protein